MSAFIVSMQTMQNVVNAVDMANRRYRNREYTFCGVDVRDSRDLVTVGNVLFNMNQEAVNQRYVEEDFAPEYVHRLHIPVTGKALAPYIKAMDCLIYQCTEGNVPDHAHYKQLVAVRGMLVDELLRGLPEYSNAKWDA